MKYLLYVLLIIFALTSGACENKEQTPETSALETQRKSFADEAAARVIETAPGIANNSIRELEGDILVAVDYPSSQTSAALSEDVYNYIQNRVREFKEEASEMAPADEESGLYTLSITYKPYISDIGVIGFKFTENMYTGKTELKDFVTALNYYADSGERAQITDFFNPSTGYLNALADTARDYLLRNEDFGGDFDEPLFIEGTAPNIQNYSNFNAAPGHKFVFYFNAGEIAPQNRGLLQTVIPMSDLSNVLNADLRALFAGSAS